MNNQQRGRLGETEAASLLEAHGYKLITTNYQSGRWGELDIICQEGGDLVFVEVKTRSNTRFGQPIEALSYGKIQRLLRAAMHYKLTHPNTPKSMRIDVVTILMDSAGTVIERKLYKNIYQG